MNEASLWIMTVVLLTIAMPSACSKDDTDPDDGRSGMRLFRDAATGCEYLAHGLGGLTPRLDAGGKQICRRAR